MKCDEVLPDVEAVLGDPEADVRWAAMGVLGAHGQGAVRGLLRAYGDGDAQSRTLVLNAFRGMGETAAIPLMEALSTGDAELRAAAAEGFVAIGRSAIGVLAARASGHSDADVRAYVRRRDCDS